jgi:HSP20 family molecular chaperone IbpA
MVGDWDAFLQQVEQWTKEMERFMAHVDKARAATFSSITLAPTAAVLWRPAANVYETADAVVVQAELAGVAPEDVTIQYDSGRLLVWGQRREAITAEAQTIHRLEIQSGRFAFRAPLPGAVRARGQALLAHARRGCRSVHANRAPNAPSNSSRHRSSSASRIDQDTEAHHDA